MQLTWLALLYFQKMLSAGIVKDALLSFVMVEDPYLEIDGQRVSEKVIIVCIISV